MPSVVPGININTQPPNTLCSGTPILFITNITGGGSAPQYKWYKNGALIPGATLPDYTDATLTDLDTVQVVLVSSAICAIPSSIGSNKMGLTVHQPVVPAVSIQANSGGPIVSGQVITFNASLANEGTMPVFQWFKNGRGIPGATSASYTTSTLVRGDVIWLQMISSAPCAMPAVVASNHLIVSDPPTSVSTASHGIINTHIYPNPNHGRFTLSAQQQIISGKQVQIRIVNMFGQQLYTTAVTPDRKEWSVDISHDDLPAGMYLLQLISDDMGISIARFQVR